MQKLSLRRRDLDLRQARRGAGFERVIQDRIGRDKLVSDVTVYRDPCFEWLFSRHGQLVTSSVRLSSRTGRYNPYHHFCAALFSYFFSASWLSNSMTMACLNPSWP